MEIMLVTSQHLDNAFAKLHKYTTFAARNYTTRPEELDNVSPVLRRSLQLLKTNRSDLFEDTLSVLSTTRSSAIANMFIEALTRGTDCSKNGRTGGKESSAAAARPIELHAHDPIRYVGDILAWVHQAMASEREFLESLFGLKESGRLVGAARPALQTPFLPKPPDLNSAVSDEARLRALLDKNLEACGRPLRIRIQQTIKSHSLISAITTYQILQLLQFYRVLMRKTMGADALLCKILSELADYANKAFFDTLEDQGQSILRAVTAPGLDLKPPVAVRDVMSTLKEILQVYQQSLLDEEDRSELDDIEPILEMALAPVTELVQAMKALKQQESEKLIFDCNCTVFVQHTLEPFAAVAEKRMQLLDAAAKSVVEQLTSLHVGGSLRLFTERQSEMLPSQFGNLLKESGIEPIIQAIDKKAVDEPLSHTLEASGRALTSAIRSFDAFLAHVDTLSSPKLALLSSHRLASIVHREALKRVTAAYERLWNAVMDEKNRYEFKSTILHRSKEEVATLLGS